MSIDYRTLAEKLGIHGRVVGAQLYGRCPLHDDQTASFSFNLQHGFWMCHAGDCVGNSHPSHTFPALVQLVLQCGPQEALKFIQTGERQLTNEQLRDHLAQLLSGQLPDGESELPNEYLRWYSGLKTNVMPLPFLGRGFTWETIQAWGLRYDPGREQVVIPVYDLDGQLRGLIARRMNPQPGQPRYDNTPRLPKHALLFGLTAQHRGQPIILTEGPLDAIWLWQNGWRAVALFGSMLHEAQLALLRSCQVGVVTEMLDNDAAGRKAAKTISGQLLKGGWLLQQIRTVTYPDGRKDPNECTPAELATMLEQPRVFMR